MIRNNKTPQVNYQFTNENIITTPPALGVSHVVAATHSGPFNDPSQIISSYTKFLEIFGGEELPVGKTISNIQKALEGGSKLRISRVKPELGKKNPYPWNNSAGPLGFIVSGRNYSKNVGNSGRTISFSDNALAYMYFGFNISSTDNGNNYIKLLIPVKIIPRDNTKIKREPMVLINSKADTNDDLQINFDLYLTSSGGSTLNKDEDYPWLKDSREIFVDGGTNEPYPFIPTCNMGAIETKKGGKAINLDSLDKFNKNPLVELRFGRGVFMSNKDGHDNPYEATNILGSMAMYPVDYSTTMERFVRDLKNLSNERSNVFSGIAGDGCYQGSIEFIISTHSPEEIANHPLEYTTFGARWSDNNHSKNSSTKTTLDEATRKGLYTLELGLLTAMSRDDFSKREFFTIGGRESNYYWDFTYNDLRGYTKEGWVEAYKALRPYTDAYSIIFSNMEAHLPVSFIDVYSEIYPDHKKDFEKVLYIEYPYEALYSISGRTFEAADKSVAYFMKGILYPNSKGEIEETSVLGTVLGLGDSSASNYGPWYSFAGPNRGVIPTAIGPAYKNLAGDLDTLQRLAEQGVNLVVVKDSINGKVPMLWHNFTTSGISNSDKFLSVVRLQLYLKKQIRPILESKIEEPNTWSTWEDIYYQVKPILDDLVKRQGITTYQWLGDQDATSYDTLEINNEADVRAGRYTIILKYKEVVSLQEITMKFNIDKVSREIKVNN